MSTCLHVYMSTDGDSVNLEMLVSGAQKEMTAKNVLAMKGFSCPFLKDKIMQVRMYGFIIYVMEL